MKAIGKIIKIIIVFLASLVVISYVWYKFEISRLSDPSQAIPFIDYVLYLLGYGEVEIDNHYSKTFFSVLSLFVLTLLSSVFTVNLFELRGKVKVGSKMLVWDKQNVHHFASIILKSGGKDVYNVKITLILSDGNKVKTEEKYIPFIPKRMPRIVDFKIAPGTVCYDYLRTIIKGSFNLPILLATVTYTDIDNGQEYTICKKYNYSKDKNKGIVFDEKSSLACSYEKISYSLFNKIAVNNSVIDTKTRAYIDNNSFLINLKQATPINASDIDISYGYSSGNPNGVVFTSERAFKANVHMNNKDNYIPEDFTMICVSRPLNGNWSAYYEMGCRLTFDCLVEGDISLTLELKYFDNETGEEKKYEQVFLNQNGFESYSLDLKKLKQDDLKNIKELCFTVFYKDVSSNNPTGSFTITNCMLEV